jgi:hypothetical protein
MIESHHYEHQEMQMTTAAAFISAIATREHQAIAQDGARAVVLSCVKPGEYVRRKADAKKTFKRGTYDRATRTYELIDCDDVCRSIHVKATALVFVGFTY